MQQNLELREAHQRRLTEMEVFKKFQSSTFDTYTRRKLIEDQEIILELYGRTQELQNEIKCVNEKSFRMLNKLAVEFHTLPVDQYHSHLIQFLKEC